MASVLCLSFSKPPPLSVSLCFCIPLTPYVFLPVPPSLTPYLSQQFHSCINQVQTIRQELVPVLPSTSWFMACNTASLPLPVSLPLSAVCAYGCLYAHLCICLRHKIVNVSRGNNVINYKTLSHCLPPFL